ncbi:MULTISPECIES: DUF1345 domain-containing protein [unclassified Beijerinckia]|uniref:DUF1345 domain-containing protein n=1 Tax=unclassified Beijerinckia TaxID=2638183 RepID=UPI0008960CA6|nr:MULTISPECIES: DUF1345 domain-containing protein [unclassified Beijerinckia]MDH7798398.1 putative membrane protein [Beijerinckia sp. GAS462]SED19567.1 Uncharacterized membrane protein [Beijerinckia sp. 28-YEA-48]
MADQTEAALQRGALARNIQARWRLLVCIAVGFICYFALPSAWDVNTRALIGWNLAISIYMAEIVIKMSGATAASIRHRAEAVDEGRFIVLALTIIAAIAAFIAVIAQLSTANALKDGSKALHLGLAILTIATSWTFIHLVFAHHYTHEFFIERESEKQLKPEDRGGLRFPGGQPPVFSDFIYFSFVIGVACQTADVSIPSRPMRRLATLHCILAFVFNTTILALTINIAAGLLATS